MKNNFLIKLFICPLLVAHTFLAGAQSDDRQERSLTTVEQNSPLFRRRQAVSYNFRHEGTPYWSTPEFMRGSVVVDGRRYDNVLVNIDAFRQEALVRQGDVFQPVTLGRDHVDLVQMGERVFVNLKRKGYDLPEGFYEAMHGDEFTIYTRLKKNLVHDANRASLDNVVDFFDDIFSYYVERDGKIAKISKSKFNSYLALGKTSALSRAVSGRHAMDPAAAQRSVPVPELSDSLRQKGAALRQGDFKIGDKTIYASLPAGFFSKQEDKRDDELLRLLNAGNEMAVFANKVYEIGSDDKASGDRAYVRGTVRDVLTGEPLIGVAVYDDRSKAYTMTDEHGTYQVRLPLGDNVLGFSGYSLEDLHLNIVVKSDGGLDVQMKEKVTSLKGAVVSAESMMNHRDARMGIEKVRINTITKVPSAFGEADVLKVVLTLPGVKSVGEASSGFNVRGGSTDQNLILFNDGTVYNPSHLFGIFSAFNTDVINDIELYKSSIPAEFGGRISSVLDVRGREGNSNKVTGSLGLGLLTSRFHVEGPIKDSRTTFIVGGRTTYSNWIFNLLPQSSTYSGGNAGFSDLNASISHKVNDRNTIHAYGYWSRDRFSFDGDTTFHYSNANASFKWHSVITNRTSLTAVAGYDHYDNTLENSFNEFSGYNVDTGIDQGFTKFNFKSVINTHHSINYGLNGIYYTLNGGHMTPLTEASLVEEKTIPVAHALEGAAYLSDTWQPRDNLSFDAGLRYSAFQSMHDKKLYGSPEFRLSGKLSFRDNLSLKAGYNTMSQYIHLISNTSSVSPMDAWHLSDASVKPQKGWQAASGLYWTVADNKVDLSLEGYYKKMSNYLDYKSGATLIMNENLTEDLVTTYGKAYGVEFMVKKALGKLNGWVSYTYSRSLLKEMEYRGVATINNGKWYAAPHDKPHDLKLVGNYKFTHRYSLSVNVDYSTGRPVTIPVSTYYYAGGMRLAYSARNGYRIPDYFRMDMALNVEPGHYLKQLTHMSLTFGVYNVTGRKNAYSIYYTNHGGTAINGYKLSVFAAPIPYINLNLKFG